MSDFRTPLIDQAQRVNIGMIPAHQASMRARSLAIADAEARMDFNLMNRRVNRLANALTHAGIRPGDRLAVRLSNSHRYFESLFACAKLAAVLAPIDAAAVSDEVDYAIRDSAAAVFLDGDEEFDTFSAGAPETEPELPALGDNPLVIMYTSGTTGRPKGAVLTHTNLLYTSLNQSAGWRISAKERALVVCPFHHVSGLLTLGFPCLHAGGEVHIAPPRPDAILEAVEREKITALFLPPMLWRSLTCADALGHANVASVRLCASGGDPIPAQFLERLIDKFQAEFTNAYGLTEASGCSTLLQGRDIIHRAGSAGEAVRHNRLRIVDPGGVEIAPGAIGEIVLAGPTVMKEYWRRPAETASAIRNGWLWTGDLGRIDEDGYLFVMGRSKDVIISDDKKVYPAELERVLRQHAAIGDAAVIGIPDGNGGHTVAAIVTLQPGAALTPSDLIEFCAGKIAEYKLPKVAFICDRLPRNAGGKILKAELRKMYGAELAR